ncbi:MAG: response regulator [Nitratireductor sp.]|nr:response regulator [Nitratireductor sp.]
MARILLVEDDESVRSFVARALEIDRHGVVVACDGEEGLERFEADPNAFDLVLTDIQMPAMDGIAMSRRISAIRTGQKILMMTGYAQQRERAAGLEHIVIDVVQKPFTLPEIRERVSSALAA